MRTLVILILVLIPLNLIAQDIPSSDRLERIKRRTAPVLATALEAENFAFGDSVYIRIFKEERQLELWMFTDSTWEPYKLYPICRISGALGPKLKQNDHQTPEGFFTLSPADLNPESKHHLSFNLADRSSPPNMNDQVNYRRGNNLEIHGGCQTANCIGIARNNIEEIYLLADAAFRAGQAGIKVHVFPFRMTPANRNRNRNRSWQAFWTDLYAGYHQFELFKIPPAVEVVNNRYRVLPIMPDTTSVEPMLTEN